MDNFSSCIAFTLDEEGGYSDNASDPGNWTGGVIGRGMLRGTNFGISAAAYPALDIAGLSRAAAEDIYHRDYWNKIEGDSLPLPVAMAVFDAAVNSGPRRAIIWAQQAAGVTADGVIGPQTRAAIGGSDGVLLAREIIVRRLDFLTRLPSWANFGLGWSRRIIALAAELQT